MLNKPSTHVKYEREIMSPILLKRLVMFMSTTKEAHAYKWIGNKTINVITGAKRQESTISKGIDKISRLSSKKL